MSWSGGTYSKGNAATGGWAGDASLGIGIEASRHDTQDNDFEAGINQCLNKDGSNAATGNLNLGGYLPTNLGAGTAAAPAICAGNDTNTGIFSPAADNIGIATNGVERVRIDNSGNVGVGTTAPGFTLDVQSTGPIVNIGRFIAATNAGGLNFRKSRGATVGANTIVQSGDSLGGVYFQGANGTGYDDGASIIAEVDGTPGASSDMPGRLVFRTTADGSASTTERMRIDSSGRVGIQDTPFSSAQFYVRSQTSSRVTGRFYQAVSGDTGTPALNLDKFDNNSTTSQIFLQTTINQQSAGNGQINANGASQLAFGTYSDERLKENITNLPGQLTNVLSLRPVEFDYKDGSGHQIGFIAQEVQQIYPDLVATGTNGMLTLSGLGKMESRLIKTIQELNAKVEALEARIATLELSSATM